MSATVEPSEPCDCEQFGRTHISARHFYLVRFYTEGARTQVHTVLDGPKGPPDKVVGNMPVSSDGSGIAEWNIDRIMEKI